MPIGKENEIFKDKARQRGPSHSILKPNYLHGPAHKFVKCKICSFRENAILLQNENYFCSLEIIHIIIDLSYFLVF